MLILLAQLLLHHLHGWLETTRRLAALYLVETARPVQALDEAAVRITVCCFGSLLHAVGLLYKPQTYVLVQQILVPPPFHCYINIHHVV